MKKYYEFAHRFRYALLVLTLVAFSMKAFAWGSFWPPDLIPHIDSEIVEEPEDLQFI